MEAVVHEPVSGIGWNVIDYVRVAKVPKEMVGMHVSERALRCRHVGEREAGDVSTISKLASAQRDSSKTRLT